MRLLRFSDVRALDAIMRLSRLIHLYINHKKHMHHTPYLPKVHAHLSVKSDSVKPLVVVVTYVTSLCEPLILDLSVIL